MLLVVVEHSVELEITKSLMMPKDIVEAYALAVKARETCTRKAFEDVVNFCENDFRCSSDYSNKRNTLLLWSYDRLAQSYAHSNDYALAYQYWRKAISLTSSKKVKLQIASDMLAAADKGFANIKEKAIRIVETTGILQELYMASSDTENYQKMQKLNNIATNLLISSKLKH